jgi:hypothetical protein
MNIKRYECNTSSLISAVLVPANIIFIQLGVPRAIEYPKLLSFYTDFSQTFYDPDVNLVGVNLPMTVLILGNIPHTYFDEQKMMAWVARGKDLIRPETPYYLTVNFR